MKRIKYFEICSLINIKTFNNLDNIISLNYVVYILMLKS